MLRNAHVDDHVYSQCGAKYEGWLRFYTCPFNGYIPKEIPWQSGYCVFRNDDLTFVCYRDPEASRFMSPGLPSFRLDSGCRVPPPPIHTSSTLPRRPISNGFSTLTRRTQRLMQTGSATLDRFSLKKRKSKMMENMTLGRGESTYMLGTIREKVLIMERQCASADQNFACSKGRPKTERSKGDGTFLTFGTMTLRTSLLDFDRDQKWYNSTLGLVRAKGSATLRPKHYNHLYSSTRDLHNDGFNQLNQRSTSTIGLARCNGSCDRCEHKGERRPSQSSGLAYSTKTLAASSTGLASTLSRPTHPRKAGLAYQNPSLASSTVSLIQQPTGLSRPANGLVRSSCSRLNKHSYSSKMLHKDPYVYNKTSKSLKRYQTDQFGSTLSLKAIRPCPVKLNGKGRLAEIKEVQRANSCDNMQKLLAKQKRKQEGGQAISMMDLHGRRRNGHQENGDLDGTESLDRFHWNQKSLRSTRRANQQMPKQTIINAHRSDMPGVALLEEPTTPQRLANFLSKPFRSNPLKRTKSVSKLERPAYADSM